MKLKNNILALYYENEQLVILLKSGNKLNFHFNSLVDGLDDLCMYSGSTLRGRIESARFLTRARQKPPFVVCPSLVLIPTKSLEHPDCVCLNAHRINKVIRDGKNCIIIFDTGIELPLHVDKRTIDNQLEIYERLINELAVHQYGLAK